MSKKPLTRQYAALPLDLRSGEMELVLVTSRTTGRWIIPKGRPEPRLPGHEVARREAYEEAGLLGVTAHRALGSYMGIKGQGNTAIPAQIYVYPMRVTGDLAEFPEKGQREIMRASLLEALMLLSDGGLVSLLLRHEHQLIDRLPPVA
ncbi:NUDIX hydrolase [Zavarzinia compransoris]|uniref:NUDIX hydrolase n=1 Tax=Zavarzinia compransoris TaxID=1264899 RepID=A0A317E0Z1_9PROT|nr:NUDIX hydrolase [Zavarzinia compransoris]PWR20619.1 NUDIX hydrolase [Zavarzinia compransoris]TDP44565.1 NUDIX domain-containing protein [Zavarzinia compransoris]